MDLESRLVISGMFAIIAGCFAIRAYFHPEADAATRAYVAMWRGLAYPRGSARIMPLVGGVVAILVGLFGLAPLLRTYSLASALNGWGLRWLGQRRNTRRSVISRIVF